MNDAILARLKKLTKRGSLTTETVLDDAKNPTSPLHNQFEWDNAVAGQRYRVEQARKLIRSIRLVVTDDKRQLTTIAYVRDPDKDQDEPGYIAVGTLRSNKEKARRALINELKRAEACLQRAYDVADSLGLSSDVERLLAQIRNIQAAA